MNECKMFFPGMSGNNSECHDVFVVWAAGSGHLSGGYITIREYTILQFSIKLLYTLYIYVYVIVYV